MNPGGPVEEAGKVAGTFMDVMRGQPLALALAVMNMILLALFFFIAKTASENRRYEFNSILETQKEVQKLLYNCTPLASLPGKRYVPQSSESHPAELTPLPEPRPPEAPQVETPPP